jgi:peptidoglycan/LPS O-acetylase OafA/YrhL
MTTALQLHPTYRSDIDGLRAVAVLSVVIFHAFPQILPGGFIGVDVFFVISGFLISTILYSNLEAGRFSIFDFYGRRIRRIFPALILVMAACYALGWFVLLPDEYAQLGKHMAGGAGFVQNFVLWSESGYFDNSAETKPLLHLWSLGIEEQFYIVWPILLWIGYRFRLNLLSITVLIAIISFVLNIRGINVTKDLIATFYSPQTRFWELLIGAIAAYLTLYPSEKLKAFFSYVLTNAKSAFKVLVWSKPKVMQMKSDPGSGSANWANIYSVVGLIILLLGMALINKHRAFPGWWALMPTIGSVLLIIAGPKAIINRTLLSSKLMVGIGLISYPLYLWHWVILSFLRIMQGEVPLWWHRAIAILVAVVLSILTYKFIEKPIRFGK